MSQGSMSLNPPAPSAPATESAQRHRPLDVAKIALFFMHHYQWDYREQQQIATALYTAMRTTFLARWAALGLVGVPLPQAAAARLRAEAKTQADQITRTHNAQLSQFIAQFTHSYLAGHPETYSSDGRALRAAIVSATHDWMEQRADWKPTQIAGHTTRLGLSFADLYADFGSGALYTVEGPELTDRSCGVCRSHYHQVLTAEEAWQLVFPAHPNCEHTLRMLTSEERTRYELTGELPH